MADGDTNNQADTPWHVGLDPALVTHATEKGWDKLDGKAALVAAITASLGTPKVIEVPAPKPEDYKLDTLKFGDGDTFETGFASAAAQAAAKAGLPVDKFTGFMTEMMGWIAQDDGREAANNTIEQAKQRAILDKEWGVNLPRNKMIANRAMQTLGIDPETMAYLEMAPKAGYAGVWKLFLRLGEAMGEAHYVDGEGGGKTLSLQQAVERREALMADKAWAARYLAGGRESDEAKEMNALLEIIARGGK